MSYLIFFWLHPQLSVLYQPPRRTRYARKTVHYSPFVSKPSVCKSYVKIFKNLRTNVAKDSFRSHPPCSNACRRNLNPFPHLQCISTKFPLTLTPCQITAAAYDGQKHIFSLPWMEMVLRWILLLVILVTQCVASQVLHWFCLSTNIRIFMNSCEFYQA